MSVAVSGPPSQRIRAYDALSAHPRLAELVSLTRDVVGKMLDERRTSVPAGARAKADDAKLGADAKTDFGDPISVLERGPDGEAERALACALFAHVLAATKPLGRDEEVKTSRDLLWLASHTAFDATELVDHALGDKAHAVWSAISELVRALDEHRSSAPGLGEALVACTALALSPSADARRQAAALANELHETALLRVLVDAPKPGRSAPKLIAAAPTVRDVAEADIDDTDEIARVAPDEKPTAAKALEGPPAGGGDGGAKDAEASAASEDEASREGADETGGSDSSDETGEEDNTDDDDPDHATPAEARDADAETGTSASERPPAKVASGDRGLTSGRPRSTSPSAYAQTRIRGELAPAPRGPIATTALAMTGILFVLGAARVIARLALAYRTPAEVTLTAFSVRIDSRVEMLGRTLRERKVIITREALVRAAREVRYPRAGFYAGLLALAIGSYVGIATLVDGVRAASPSLLLTGLVIVAAGIGLDFLLGSIAPGARGRCRVLFVPRTGPTVCIGAVDVDTVDDALSQLAAARR